MKLLSSYIKEMKIVEPTEFKMKAIEFDVTNQETGEVESFDFDATTIVLETYEEHDLKTGDLIKTAYIAMSEEEMIRLSYQERKIGATVADEVEASVESQVVRKLGDIQTLNNRENMVPVMVVFMGSLMGFFIVMAYIFLDKSEGVIRAFASLGLLISSFFDNISQSFGILYAIMIALMIPAFSYYIPSFDPLWLRFFPTYPLLQSMKEIIMVNTDVSYVLTYCAVFAAGGILLFLIANSRFKKTLTV